MGGGNSQAQPMPNGYAAQMPDQGRYANKWDGNGDTFRGTDVSEPMSQGAIQDSGDSPELLKNVSPGGAMNPHPDELEALVIEIEQSLTPEQTEAINMLHANLPLVLMYAADENLDGESHPLIQEIDQKMEAAFPGYKSLEEELEDMDPAIENEIEGEKPEESPEQETSEETNDDEKVSHAQSVRDALNAGFIGHDVTPRTARRWPKMCPSHKSLVQYALELKDPVAAKSLAEGQSCGDEGYSDKCNFKPAMVTERYWDEHDARIEERRERKLQEESQRNELTQQYVDESRTVPESEMPEGESIVVDLSEFDEPAGGVEDFAPTGDALVTAARDGDRGTEVCHRCNHEFEAIYTDGHFTCPACDARHNIDEDTSDDPDWREAAFETEPKSGLQVGDQVQHGAEVGTISKIWNDPMGREIARVEFENGGSKPIATESLQPITMPDEVHRPFGSPAPTPLQDRLNAPIVSGAVETAKIEAGAVEAAKLGFGVPDWFLHSLPAIGTGAMIGYAEAQGLWEKYRARFGDQPAAPEQVAEQVKQIAVVGPSEQLPGFYDQDQDPRMAHRDEDPDTETRVVVEDEGEVQAAWVDTAGHPLREGGHYLMKAKGYTVPDRIRVEAAQGDNLVYIIETAEMRYRDEMGRDELAANGYEFEPVQSNHEEAAPQAETADAQGDVIVASMTAEEYEDDGDENFTCKDCGGLLDGFGTIEHPGCDCSKESKVHTSSRIPDAHFGYYSKTAGRTFSPDEERELIDEGVGVYARNLHKISLEGTHYDQNCLKDLSSETEQRLLDEGLFW
jgi:protein-arginine kinase activator protein McsA